jgi:ribonuclease VapC
LDASALLCLINGEPGMERVLRVLKNSSISVVNVSEVIAKRIDFGDTPEQLIQDIADLELKIIDMDFTQAALAGRMRALTRTIGLSLGDRACLALAKTMGATALTSDRSWLTVAAELGVSIELLR